MRQAAARPQAVMLLPQVPLVLAAQRPTLQAQPVRLEGLLRLPEQLHQGPTPR